MATTSRFKVKDAVFYSHLNAYGTIQVIINANDPDDIFEQGYRYEVFFKSIGLYSVLETNLCRRKQDDEKNKRSESLVITKV